LGRAQTISPKRFGHDRGRWRAGAVVGTGQRAAGVQRHAERREKIA